MKKAITVLFVFLVLLVLLLGAATALSPIFLNKYKEPILAKIGETVNREVRLGELRLTLFTGIGLRLKEVSISNAEGFREEPMFSMAELDLKVRFLPLLHKEIVVDRVILRKPRILIEKDEKGNFNFSDLVGETKPSEPPAEKSDVEPEDQPPLTALAGLLVSKITLSEGVFSFYDAGSEPLKNGVHIQNIDLMLEDVSLEKPISFSLSFGVNRDAKDVRLNGTLGPVGKTIDFEKVPLSIQMTIQEFALSRIMDFLGEEPPVLIQEGRLTTSVDLSGDLASGLRIAGTINVASLTLSDPTKEEPLVNKLNLDLYEDLSFYLKKEKIVIQKARISIDRAEINFKGEVSELLNDPSLTLQISSNDIPLKDWNTTFPTFPGPGWDTSIKVEGDVAGKPSGKINVSMKISSNTGFGEQGSTSFDIKADLGVEKPTYAGSLQLSRIDLSKLQEAFAKREEKIEGELTAQVNLSGSGFAVEEIKENLAGDGNFKIERGLLRNVNLEKKIFSAISSKFAIPVETLTEMTGVEISEGDQTPFEECYGTFRIGSGRIDIMNVVITSENHGFSAQGTVGLNQKLDLNARMVLRKLGEVKKKKFTYYLVDDKSRKYIPFKVTGETSDPKVRVDTDKLIKGQVQEVVDKKMEKLEEKLKEKLGPGAEELLKPLKDLFKF